MRKKFKNQETVVYIILGVCSVRKEEHPPRPYFHSLGRSTQEDPVKIPHPTLDGIRRARNFSYQRASSAKERIPHQFFLYTYLSSLSPPSENPSSYFFIRAATKNFDHIHLTQLSSSFNPSSTYLSPYQRHSHLPLRIVCLHHPATSLPSK